MRIEVKFSYYRGLEPDHNKEKVARGIIKILRNHLFLPDKVEVQFVSLGPANHAETIVNVKRPNVVRLNADLSVNDIVIPLVHEMIHVEQIYTGKLKNSRFGYLIWEDQKYKVDPDMAYNKYLELPWEQDVNYRLGKLLEIVLG